jgi:hypothetical protein
VGSGTGWEKVGWEWTPTPLFPIPIPSRPTSDYVPDILVVFTVFQLSNISKISRTKKSKIKIILRNFYQSKLPLSYKELSKLGLANEFKFSLITASLFLDENLIVSFDSLPQRLDFGFKQN